jgi:hypothetical protein
MNKVLLIDADALIYYEAFKEQSIEDALVSIKERVLQMCRDNNCYNYIGFLTGGGPDRCFRYDIAKTKPYKGARTAEKPVLFDPIKRYLKDELHCQISSGLEADDLVAYWKYNLGIDSIICSPDKDVLYQIPGTHYNYKWNSYIDRGRLVTTSEEAANKFLWQQCMTGDSTDGIPGITGIGEKKAIAILDADPNTSYEIAVFNKYRAVFGIAEGLLKMLETYRLVYLLRTPADILRELSITLDMPIIRHIEE